MIDHSYITQFVINNDIADRSEFTVHPYDSQTVARRIKVFAKEHPDEYAELLPELVEYVGYEWDLGDHEQNEIYFYIVDTIEEGVSHSPHLIVNLRELMKSCPHRYLKEILRQRNAEEIRYFMLVFPKYKFQFGNEIQSVIDRLAKTPETYDEFTASVHLMLKEQFGLYNICESQALAILYALTSKYKVIRLVASKVIKADYICMNGRERLTVLSDRINLTRVDLGHALWVLQEIREDTEIPKLMRKYARRQLEEDLSPQNVGMLKEYQMSNTIELYVLLFGLNKAKSVFRNIISNVESTIVTRSIFCGIARHHENLKRGIGKFFADIINDESISHKNRFALIRQISEEYSQSEMSASLKKAISAFYPDNTK